MLAPRYVNLISYICVGRGINTLGNTKVQDIWKYNPGLQWFSMILHHNFMLDSLYIPMNANTVHRMDTNGDSFPAEK